MFLRLVYNPEMNYIILPREKTVYIIEGVIDNPFTYIFTTDKIVFKTPDEVEALKKKYNRNYSFWKKMLLETYNIDIDNLLNNPLLQKGYIDIISSDRRMDKALRNDILVLPAYILRYKNRTIVLNNPAIVFTKVNIYKYSSTRELIDIIKKNT